VWLIVGYAGTSDSVASFFRAFSDQISLRVPNLPAYLYKRACPIRFKSRHWVQFPKFPCKGILSVSPQCFHFPYAHCSTVLNCPRICVRSMNRIALVASFSENPSPSSLVPPHPAPLLLITQAVPEGNKGRCSAYCGSWYRSYHLSTPTARTRTRAMRR
jgi:hypothetical protein